MDDIVFVEADIQVMLIEDNPGDVILFMHAAQKLKSLDITNVKTTREAIKLLSQHQFDVAFVDLNLIDNMGASSVDAVKKAAPDLPIVVVTGIATETTKNQCKAAGAKGFLLKSEVSTDKIAQYLLALGFSV